jgi:hypothetical protein
MIRFTRHLVLPLLPAAALLTACGEMTPSANESAIRIANPVSDQLKAASTLNQRITLRRAVGDSGKRCRRVDALGYQQEYRGMAMWVALCDDGRHWAVFIAPNADVQVRDCTQNAQLGLPVCRPVAPLPPDPNAPPNSNRTIAGAGANGVAENRQ